MGEAVPRGQKSPVGNGEYPGVVRTGGAVFPVDEDRIGRAARSDQARSAFDALFGKKK